MHCRISRIFRTMDAKAAVAIRSTKEAMSAMGSLLLTMFTTRRDVSHLISVLQRITTDAIGKRAVGTPSLLPQQSLKVPRSTATIKNPGMDRRRNASCLCSAKVKKAYYAKNWIESAAKSGHGISVMRVASGTPVLFCALKECSRFLFQWLQHRYHQGLFDWTLVDHDREKY